MSGRRRWRAGREMARRGWVSGKGGCVEVVNRRLRRDV